MFKLFILKLFRLYFRSFPIRKGKIPVLRWIQKKGISKGITRRTTYDYDILIETSLDDWIQKQIYFFGRYEIEKFETRFWKDFIKPGMVVFDVGANIGYYSLMAGKRVQVHGMVYSFEPVQETFMHLNRNIQMNSFSNIRSFKLALSDTEGYSDIYTANRENTGTAGFSNHIHFSGQKETVETITGDLFIDKQKIEKLDMIKIDVEGTEMKVLKGLAHSIKKHKPLILAEINRILLERNDANPEEIFSFFSAMNYRSNEIDKFGNLVPFKGVREGNLIAFIYS